MIVNCIGAGLVRMAFVIQHLITLDVVVSHLQLGGIHECQICYYFTGSRI